MDRASAPETVTSEIAWIDSERFDGSGNLETLKAPPYQVDRSTASNPGLELILDEGCPEPATESSTLIGRPDIDTAMLDALRHATVSDHGFPGPGWVAPDRSRFERGQSAVVPQIPHRGDSTKEPAPPASRPDIDTAMLDALRHAIESDPRFRDG
jgi:hypothetical protein